METWAVRPGEAIGPLRLGMTRAEAREEMAEAGETGRGEEELWFAGMRVRADFDADDRIEFVEAASDAPLRLGDFQPFKADRDEVVECAAALLRAPAETLEGGSTVRFDRHGLVFWGYDQHSRDERGFEAIAVFAPGYNDR